MRRLPISASSLQRLIDCPASAALPQVRKSGPAARRGTEVHEYLARVGELGRDKALELVPESSRAFCESIDTDALPTDLAHEVAFAYDLLIGEAREIGRGLDRDYGELGPFEIPGTADVVGLADTHVYVPDYKTGRSWVPPARSNPQLLFLALCATKVFGRSEAIVEIIRIKEDGSVFGDRAHLTAADLADFDRLIDHQVTAAREAATTLEQGRAPDVELGPWCKYCPSKTHCPGHTGLIRTALDEDDLNQLRREAGELAPEQLGRLWLRAKPAYEMLGMVLNQIRAIVETTEEAIPLGDGRVLAPHRVKGRESFDGEIGWQVMNKLFGKVAANDAVGRQITKAGIKAALKKASSDNVAGDERRVFDAIRERNGARRTADRIEAREKSA